MSKVIYLLFPLRITFIIDSSNGIEINEESMLMILRILEIKLISLKRIRSDYDSPEEIKSLKMLADLVLIDVRLEFNPC